MRDLSFIADRHFLSWDVERINSGHCYVWAWNDHELPTRVILSFERKHLNPKHPDAVFFPFRGWGGWMESDAAFARRIKHEMSLCESKPHRIVAGKCGTASSHRGPTSRDSLDFVALPCGTWVHVVEVS